jgi:hypothetical protein
MVIDRKKKDGGYSGVKVKYTLLTAILLVFVLLVTVVPVASAKSNTGNDQSKPVNGVAIEKMIEKLERFVTRCDDGTFRLDIPADAKIDRTSREFKAISAGMSAINRLIREGTLVSTPNLSVYSTDDDRFVLQAGVNRFKSRWYGFEIWLDHETCQGILAASGGVGGVAGILAAVLPGIPKAVAAVVAGFCVVNLSIVSAYDDGYGIHMKFLYPVAGPLPFPFHVCSQSG